MEFNLHDGPAVRLVSLEQSMTYDGMLEGSSTAAGNKSRVRAAAMKGPSHLPDEALTRYKCVLDMHDSFERDQRLLAVVCQATLRSHEPVHDAEAHESELRVTWRQDQFAMPTYSYSLEKT